MSDHRRSTHIDDATLQRKLNKTQKTRRPLTLGTVTIYAPDARGYWRLLVYAGSRRLNRSGGRSIESCVKAFRRLDDEDRHDSSTTVDELIDDYVAQRGAKGRWGDRTQKDRARDFKLLRELGAGIRASQLDRATLQAFLDSVGTQKRYNHLRNVTATFLMWASSVDDVPSDLAPWVRGLGLRANGHIRITVGRADARRRAGSLEGNVPSHREVDDWAHEAAKNWKPAFHFVHLLANTGLRLSEACALTLDPALSPAAGNLIDTDRWEIHVDVQRIGPGRVGPPKGAKTRVVVIPPGSWTQGIDLRAWLRSQPKQGYLFQDSNGSLADGHNLYRRVFRPAASRLGWKIPATDNSRSYMRFVLHSLRARYATTAANDWGFTRAQLQQQGGWEPGTVERFYQGFDRDTADSVRSLFKNKRSA